MSNVRLSNGSPTLERTDARGVSSSSSSSSSSDHHHPPKPSFCRSLFGPVDHDELQRDLKGHLREMEEAAAAKWSFDFARHTPLPTTCGGARFEWEAVDCKDLPDFYSTTSSRSSPSTGNNNNNSSSSVDLNGNHHHHHHSCAAGGGQGAGSGRQPPAGGAAGAVVAAAVDDDDGERCEGQQVDCSEQCRHGQRKRPAACQDTATQSKRSLTHTGSDEVRCLSFSSPAEHTPRKSSPRRQT